MAVVVYKLVPSKMKAIFQKQKVDKMDTKPVDERIRVSYDETNQRVREIEQFFYNPTPGKEIYEVISLHKEVRI